MAASAEIIDLRAERERRKAAAPLRLPEPAPAPSAVAWVPVWFFGPVWMCMPMQTAEARDG